MLKNFLWVMLCLLFILVGAGYIVYVNRAVITDKVVAYVMGSLTGKNTSDKNKQTWADSLMQAGMKSLQSSVKKALSEKEIQTENDKGYQNRGLSTVADMLTDGTNGNSDDMARMAQALLRGLGNALGEDNSENSKDYSHNDINMRDSKGRTLLMNVCRVDVTPRVIKMILKYGADINAQDNNGRTALMYAVALNQNPEVVLSLLNKGADARIKDNQGNTALSYAKDDEVRLVLLGYAR